MKLKKLDLTPFERGLWLGSALTVSAAFWLNPAGGALHWIASLIGVTALVFVAKGRAIGQILTVVFAAFYGVISWHFAYYGEMITYLGMTSPIAVLTVVEWLRHPYEHSAEVAVRRMTRPQTARMFALTALVTAAFYFILRALGTARLPLSTLSVATSFLASYLTLMRSPAYAFAYAANDAVLVTLWLLAIRTDPSALPMVACFGVFFVNDSYGFVNWRRMAQRQGAAQ
ncbi:MAG: nicotinamide riboside transporter PnuC [Eubacteriales bacterium]|nr:nicotinamide riboside transporter PnuC [Eubacteriales bacterium]